MSRPEVQNASRRPSAALAALGITLTTLGAVATGITDPGSAAQGVSFFATGAGGVYSTYELAPIIGEGVARSVGLFSKPGEQRVRDFGKSLSAATANIGKRLFGEKKSTAASMTATAHALPTIAEGKDEEADTTADNDIKYGDAVEALFSSKDPISPTRGAANTTTYQLGGRTITKITVASKLDKSQEAVHGIVPQ